MRLKQRALLNAYILYAFINDDPMPRNKFYYIVIEAMCGLERFARLQGMQTATMSLQPKKTDKCKPQVVHGMYELKVVGSKTFK